MKAWKRIEPTTVTKVGRRTIVTKTFTVPETGETTTFATFRAEGVPDVGVIALTKDKQVIVARQFRAGPERFMDEIPCGAIYEGEDLEACAQRELLEETGYIAGKLEYLGANTRDAYANGKWHYYLGTDCVLSPDGRQLDEDEEQWGVEVKLISIKDFIQSAKDDQMTDPAAVLLAYDKLLELDS